MKTTVLLIILTALSASTRLNAQQSNIAADTLSKRPQAFYFELLGTGGLYSINYDTRFKKQADGLGIRGGISYTQVTDATLFTLPIQVNYLLGKNEKFFELGLGATYATASLNLFENEEDGETSGSTVIGTMTFGYRKQPIDGGFMFRGGVSPVFGRGYFIPYYPYLSFGYSF